MADSTSGLYANREYRTRRVLIRRFGHRAKPLAPLDGGFCGAADRSQDADTRLAIAATTLQRRWVGHCCVRGRPTQTAAATAGNARMLGVMLALTDLRSKAATPAAGDSTASTASTWRTSPSIGTSSSFPYFESVMAIRKHKDHGKHKKAAPVRPIGSTAASPGITTRPSGAEKAVLRRGADLAAVAGCTA